MEKRLKGKSLSIFMVSDWEDEEEPATQTKRKWLLSPESGSSRSQQNTRFKKEGVIGHVRAPTGEEK